MGGFYFFLAIISFTGTLFAVVQARRLYWAAPLYFMIAWLTGELALIHLLWQVILTAILAFFGQLDSGLAQFGLGLFALSWAGMVYLQVQSMDTQRILRRALRRGLGVDYRASLPTDRQRVLEDGVQAFACIPISPMPMAGNATCSIFIILMSPVRGGSRCCCRCTVVAG